MCTALLPPGGYPIAVNKHIISYHSISYHIIPIDHYYKKHKKIISCYMQCDELCRTISFLTINLCLQNNHKKIRAYLINQEWFWGNLGISTDKVNLK
jgi:hypothetical protein